MDSTLWDESNSEKFKTAINNYTLGDLTTKQSLEAEALKFIEHIANSKQLISTKPNKRKRPYLPITKPEALMNQLLKKKLTLTNSLRRTQNKNNKKNTWEKILLIQKEIQIQATKLYSETYKPLWNTLTKIDCESLRSLRFIR